MAQQDSVMVRSLATASTSRLIKWWQHGHQHLERAELLSQTHRFPYQRPQGQLFDNFFWSLRFSLRYRGDRAFLSFLRWPPQSLPFCTSLCNMTWPLLLPTWGGVYLPFSWPGLARWLALTNKMWRGDTGWLPEEASHFLYLPSWKSVRTWKEVWAVLFERPWGERSPRGWAATRKRITQPS